MRLGMLLSTIAVASSQKAVQSGTVQAASAPKGSDSAEDRGRLMRLKGGAAWSESPAVSLPILRAHSVRAAVATRRPSIDGCPAAGA
jgi:hypothetical protein